MVIDVIMTRFWMVLANLSSLSKEKREVQEEPIVSIAPIDRLINVIIIVLGMT